MESSQNNNQQDLYTDDCSYEVSTPTKVRFVDLVHCLGLVHVPKHTNTNAAWHVAGMDLAMTINPEMRRMFLMMQRNSVEMADSRFQSWKQYVREHPGDTFLCGPNADQAAMKHFDVKPENTLRTEQRDGGITVVFDPQLRKWMVE
jgi:hypothetical protein